MALLEVNKLQVSYGPIQAVRGIDLKVEEGQIVALLGANGAGKTSTLRAISGVQRPSGGQITIAGETLGKRACKVAHQGISMSPEGRLIFYGYPVVTNVSSWFLEHQVLNVFTPGLADCGCGVRVLAEPQRSAQALP